MAGASVSQKNGLRGFRLPHGRRLSIGAGFAHPGRPPGLWGVFGGRPCVEEMCMNYLHSDVSLPNTAPTDTKITTGPISTQSSIKFFGPRLYRRLVLSNGSSPYSRNGTMNEGQVLGGTLGSRRTVLVAAPALVMRSTTGAGFGASGRSWRLVEATQYGSGAVSLSAVRPRLSPHGF